MDYIFLIFLLFYIVSSLLLLPYPINLVYLAFKSRNYKDLPPKSFFKEVDLPTVALQIPVYNEPNVIHSTLKNILDIDYPRDKLFVTILDDSTDATSYLIDEFLGTETSDFQITVKRRKNRTGYKAGALHQATLDTQAEFIAIFDADCKIPSNFLRNTVHYFTDESIGAIQTRWNHTNMKFSLFTLAMSIGLDGHFNVEKLGRMKTNGFIAFNGTGGIWRRSAILEAGNWSSKTLAEDLDIAFRYQFIGKNVHYLYDVTVQQEIAPTLKLWGIQQTRWSRGFAQNLRLHMSKVLTGVHRKNRFQGAIQLTAYLVPFFLLINIVSSASLLFFKDFSSYSDFLVIFNIGLTGVSISGLLVYSVAIKRAHRPLWHILLIPLFLFWGLSLIIRIFIGVLQGFVRFGGEFKRTPKFDLDNNHQVQTKTKIKMPLDATVFIELIFLLFIGLAVFKTLEIGPVMILGTIFYIYVFLSLFLMFASSITHYLASK